ncbi:hypothetical protein DIPPA_02827 [Diplonema papillatum]|nr:hypothetical protein DIPPA_02827 [Diplonema papillatum]
MFRLPVHNDVTAPAPQEAKTGKGKRRVARPPRQPVPKNPPDAAEAHDDAKEAAPPGGAAEPAPADPQPQAQADSAPAAAVDGAEDPAADDAAKPADKPAPDGKKEAAKPAPKPKGKKK